ncbi:MAG: NUDIX hydrolase [Roseburia sp.]|nr:NUDIX hydrolase [Roseburia sp.]MCM1097120.1 NUDIX hydrolase [Ruminococcus flavefaciens]
MEKLRQAILAYCPGCEQEEADRRMMLELLETRRNLLTRENTTAHFTASAWLTNESRTKVLMVYHNIYRSWSWTGGHADGEADLLRVARREAMEETGLQKIRTVSEDIYSLEILTVDGHIKRGSYVPSHLHLNVTYLLEADEREELAVKPDENSGVRWFPLEEALQACTEPWMVQWIYSKLNDRLG